jgi:ribosomal protein S18 acetylase RimI-like enzyme
MNYSIREFRDFDIAEIYLLVSDVYNTSEGMSESLEEKFPTLESFVQYAKVLEDRPGNLALVAESGGELHGYLTVMPRYQAKLRHTSELNMGVDHASRGHGVGKMLLEEALKRARALGILEIIYLMVRADNTSAIKLYKNMGFDRLAVLKNDTRTPKGYYDGWLMRKFLNESFQYMRFRSIPARSIARIIPPTIIL